jgi:hypothetical protein
MADGSNLLIGETVINVARQSQSELIIALGAVELLQDNNVNKWKQTTKQSVYT